MSAAPAQPGLPFGSPPPGDPAPAASPAPVSPLQFAGTLPLQTGSAGADDGSGPPLAPLAVAASVAAPAARRLGPLIDPGWLFLIPGVALIAFTVIIPAQHDLEEARYFKSRVQAVQDHRDERIGNYQRYLEALERGDENLIRSLAATQLNQVDQRFAPLLQPEDTTRVSASVFTQLEPKPLVLPERPVKQMSTLERWATQDDTRVWLLAAGAMCILLGLLPPTRRR
ncbi:MAG: hypothetical protein LW650_12770 [Planctomycetaceae bacterium]|nr:hypothetical protein [Phycisphaerales bacterium]MCE2654288.1 hypothetical protein [Planctomycetaceae bacterium]